MKPAFLLPKRSLGVHLLKCTVQLPFIKGIGAPCSRFAVKSLGLPINGCIQEPGSLPCPPSIGSVDKRCPYKSVTCVHHLARHLLLRKDLRALCMMLHFLDRAQRCELQCVIHTPHLHVLCRHPASMTKP